MCGTRSMCVDINQGLNNKRECLMCASNTCLLKTVGLYLALFYICKERHRICLHLCSQKTGDVPFLWPVCSGTEPHYPQGKLHSHTV